MTAKRIFVLSDHLMFAQGLESLLYPDEDFQIVGQEASTERGVEQVRSIQPDIVIIDRSGLFKNSLELEQILQAQPTMKVIGLSLNDNSLHVYKASQLTVRSVNDLRRVLAEI